jgi:hypothetical protein
MSVPFVGGLVLRMRYIAICRDTQAEGVPAHAASAVTNTSEVVLPRYEVTLPHIEVIGGAMTPVLEGIFGSRSAAQVLLFLEAYGSGHALRIAETYSVSVSPIQRQLRRLEANGVLLSHTAGKTRLFEFNTRNPTVRNLRAFLMAELELLPEEEVKAYYRQRQRPRRAGKRL